MKKPKYYVELCKFPGMYVGGVAGYSWQVVNSRGRVVLVGGEMYQSRSAMTRLAKDFAKSAGFVVLWEDISKK